MPSGFPSKLLTQTTNDAEIVRMYRDELCSVRKLSDIFLFTPNNKSTIVAILIRNNVTLRNNKTFSIDENRLKKCSKCKGIKSIDCFYTKGKYRHSHCSECRKTEIRNPETNKAWEKANPEKVRVKEKRRYAKRRSNILYVIKTRISTSISGTITAKKQKTSSTFNILGYTVERLKEHLEGLFIEGMTWENYGQWHIDHVRPIASFEFNSEEDIRIAWSLSNLQPLWASKNASKGSLYNGKRHYYGKESTN